MGRIQSNIGLVTGTDIQKTVDQLMAISARPRDLAQNRVSGFQAQQVAVNELMALVISVQLQSNRLGVPANLSNFTTTSSKPDVVTATATGTPTTGSYSMRVVQTSQTSSAASNVFSSSNDKLTAGEFVVRTGGFLDDSMLLDELRGGAGVSRGKISLTDRTGSSREVDLRFAVNMDDVVKAINSTQGIQITASLDGDRLVLTDTSGSTTSNLMVEEVGDGRTASDLGISGVNVASNSVSGENLSFMANGTRLASLLDGRGIRFNQSQPLVVRLADETELTITPTAGSIPSTVGQLVSMINSVDSSKLEARIADNGQSIELVDKTTGPDTFRATGALADQLGWANRDADAGVLGGNRIQNALQGPLLSSLLGGQGTEELGSIDITNRSGTTTSIDLSGAESLREVMNRINQSGAGVTAALNRERNGLLIQDNTGASSSNLVISNSDATNTASNLRIEADVATSSFDSGSLDLQFISKNTALSSLNQGQGIRLGSIETVDSAGQRSAINLSQLNVKTVGDVIDAINGTSNGVRARLNDTGDGLLLYDTASGSGTMRVDDVGNGNAARDLRIRGNAVNVDLGGSNQQRIDGNQNFRMTLDGTETLADFVSKVNSANGPLTASILTAGPSTVRVLFTSRASGEAGRVVANGDAIGMSVTSTSVGRDAVIAVGASEESGGTLVRSSNNTFDQVIEGIRFNVSGVSNDIVQVSVAKSNERIESNLQLLVDQFNKVIDKLKEETRFDQTSGTTGLLFGTNEALRVEQSLTRLITTRIRGQGSIQSIEQLGISFTSEGKLTFDKARLNSQLAADTEGVNNFFTSENGFSKMARDLLDGVVGVNGGLLVSRSESLQRQIELGNQRIESLNVRLAQERQRLFRQFVGMEEAIAKLQTNISSINNIQYIEMPR